MVHPEEMKVLPAQAVPQAPQEVAAVRVHLALVVHQEVAVVRVHPALVPEALHLQAVVAHLPAEEVLLPVLAAEIVF